jgi:hypothetical protein
MVYFSFYFNLKFVRFFRRTLYFLSRRHVICYAYGPRVVIGLLARHNTLTRHWYIMGLSNNPICRKCGPEEGISVHILYECEALVSLRHTHVSFFLDPEDIRKLSTGVTRKFGKGTGLLYFRREHGAQWACPKAQVHRARKVSNPNTIQFKRMDSLKLWDILNTKVT